MSEQRAANGPAISLSAAAAAVREFLLSGERLQHARAAYLGLVTSDTTVVDHLGTDGPLSGCELAQRVRLTPSTLGPVIERLEGRGLVRHIAAERYSRAVQRRQRTLVVLTTEGQRVHSQLRTSVMQAVHNIDLGRLDLLAEDLMTLADTFNARAADLHS